MNRREFLAGAAAPSAAPCFAQAPRRLVVAKRHIEVLGRAAEVYGILDGTGKRGMMAEFHVA